MLQRWLTFLLAMEVVVYGVFTVVLTGRGWASYSTILVILLIAFLWRLSHALGSFFICGGMRLIDGRRDAGMLTALVGEFTSRLTSFNISQPFVGLVMPDEPAGDRARAVPPILLVHGYFSNRGMWLRFRQRLLAQTATALSRENLGMIYTITLEPPFGAIEVFAEQLHARIEAICAETSQPQLIVIAHSMGGLVTRAYMVGHGPQRIAQFVTLGTPHHGTRTAWLGLGTCVTQMRWLGPWIAALAEQERVAANAKPPTVSIYSTNDDIVYPPESSQLAWADNMPVCGVGHVGLLFSAGIVAQVVDVIAQCQQGVRSKNA